MSCQSAPVLNCRHLHMLSLVFISREGFFFLGECMLLTLHCNAISSFICYQT
ncbi:unnamed protein product [Staurois parvus]|uniref:NADH dehydrogenase subunit 4L n=1 Tax=Staurois parvus TaxID=386267 RepID=A0ABN9D8D4_9NEOB|nr:unnamed protein product [Staurois parvus]